jgi:peptidoglycan hydrolase-like protein with peptidoglycan-binding domain
MYHDGAVATPLSDRPTHGGERGDHMTDTVAFDDVIHYPTLRRNEPHNQVTALQYLLRHRGHSIAADGIFGPKTEAAVRAFQASANLVADGIVGRRTWPAVVVTIRRNSRGDAVRAMQYQDVLRDETGNPPRPLDGIFGPKTERSVRGFQEVLAASFPGDHIAVDGIVGPVTWRAYISGFLVM